jgi:small subunit ribosomal protein S6
MTNDYKNMITTAGSQITSEENWGRRKLAFPIEKLNEGKYVLLYVSSETGKTALPEVEHRLRQNEKILRFLTVRTDEDLKRAKHKHPVTDGGVPVGTGEEREAPAAGADSEPQEGEA